MYGKKKRKVSVLALSGGGVVYQHWANSQQKLQQVLQDLFTLLFPSEQNDVKLSLRQVPGLLDSSEEVKEKER